jgi:hypothetical protein
MKQTCLLILGMHRSGTSALTKVLNLMGATLPVEMFEPNSFNTAGYWEPSKIVRYNNRFLQECGSAWHDSRLLNLADISVKRRNQIKADFVDLIKEEYKGAPLFVVKDPRICRFAEIFIEALTDHDVNVVPVLAFRNPLEVIASNLSRKSLWPVEYGASNAALLWLTHCLEAEKATRHLKRAVVSYSSLMNNWEEVVNSLSKIPHVNFPERSADVKHLVEEFLTPTMHHHINDPNDLATNPILDPWVIEVFESFRILENKPHSELAQRKLTTINNSIEQSRPIIEDISKDASKTISDTRAANKELSIKIDSLETKRDELATLNNELNDRINTLDHQLNIFQTKISGFENQVGTLQKQLDTTAWATKVKDVRIKGLNHQLSQKRKNRSLLSSLFSKYFPTSEDHKKEQHAVKLISASPLFDPDWYLEKYPDVVKQNIDPALHYLRHGAYEGRNPSKNFNSILYLANNSEVLNSGINPLVHFTQYGQAASRVDCDPSESTNGL